MLFKILEYSIEEILMFEVLWRKLFERSIERGNQRETLISGD